MMVTTHLPRSAVLAVLLLGWAFGGTRPTDRPWPTREVFEALLTGNERASFRLEVFSSSLAGAGHITVLGDRGGSYEFGNPVRNLFRQKLKDQFGRYTFKLSEAQFRAVLTTLRDSPFVSLKHPKWLIADTAIRAIRLKQGGKTRFVRFPSAKGKTPADFRKLWDALVGVVGECELVPEKALAVEAKLPERVAKGAELRLSLVIRNIGTQTIALPNPLSTAWKDRFRVILRAQKVGADATPLVTEFEFAWNPKEPPSLRLPPSEDVKFSLATPSRPPPGQYAVVVETLVLLPRGPDAKLGIVGRAVTDEVRVTVE